MEQVTGEPFSDYVAEHVLVPARMTDSGYFEMDALLEHRLLSPASTACLLFPHVGTDEDNWDYGYGLWSDQRDEEMFKYYLMGNDPDANFHSAVFPAHGIMAVVCSNQTDGAFWMMKAIEDELTREW